MAKFMTYGYLHLILKVNIRWTHDHRSVAKLKRDFSENISEFWLTYRIQGAPGVASPVPRRREGSLLWTAGNSLSNAAQDTINLLCARAPFWLLFNLVSTRMSFSVNLLSSWAAPSMSWCLGLFLPRCRILPLLNSVRFLSPHFSSLQGPSGWQHIHSSGIAASPPGSHHLQTC